MALSLAVMSSPTTTGEQLTWAHDGMRDWVEKAAAAERPMPKDDSPTVGLAGFVLSPLGFLFPFLWIVAIIMSRSALKEAKEKHLEPGLALWGFIISAVMIAIGVLLSILFFALGATASLG